MKDTRLYVRQFLNKPQNHTVGYILAEVGNSEEGNTEIILTIGDCRHQITLEFPVYSAEDRKNSLYKARLLADTLTKFEEALKIECERAAQKKRRSRDW